MIIKNSILIYPLILMGFVVMLTYSCKKDETKSNSNNNIKQSPVTVTDTDGNIYHTVTIGTQVWMVENLKVTHYCNGDPIPNVTDNSWIYITTGAYCDYNDTPAYSATYGRIYNWYAVGDNRKLAPTGWHIPSDTEWTILSIYLGGDSIAGGKLKESGTTHWLTPNTGATNSSGFSALPGGFLFHDGLFTYLGSYGIWWSSSTNLSSVRAWYRKMSYNESSLIRDIDDKDDGFYVRCIKN